MLIREVKKQTDGTEISFEGTVTSCQTPVLSSGKYTQIVRLADGSGTVWANFILGTKRNPLHNGTNIIIKEAEWTGGSELQIKTYTIPTKSEPEPGSPYEYNPAHPADEMSKEDWAAKDERMARMSALNNATRLIVCIAEISGNAKVAFDINHVKDTACKFLAWIYDEKK